PSPVGGAFPKRIMATAPPPLPFRRSGASFGEAGPVVGVPAPEVAPTGRVEALSAGLTHRPETHISGDESGPLPREVAAGCAGDRGSGGVVSGGRVPPAGEGVDAGAPANAQADRRGGSAVDGDVRGRLAAEEVGDPESPQLGLGRPGGWPVAR